MINKIEISKEVTLVLLIHTGSSDNTASLYAMKGVYDFEGSDEALPGERVDATLLLGPVAFDVCHQLEKKVNAFFTNIGIVCHRAALPDD